MPNNAIHTHLEDQFESRIYNGPHENNIEFGSTVGMYNHTSKQFALVGVTKDTHFPPPQIPNEYSVRALMSHNDPAAKVSKLIVAEPGELTISVQDDQDPEGQPLATIQMSEESEDIIIANGYKGSHLTNRIKLSPEETRMQFRHENNGILTELVFNANGLQLIKDGVVTWETP